MILMFLETLKRIGKGPLGIFLALTLAPNPYVFEPLHTDHEPLHGRPLLTPTNPIAPLLTPTNPNTPLLTPTNPIAPLLTLVLLTNPNPTHPY
jgi:hypothetical protein